MTNNNQIFPLTPAMLHILLVLVDDEKHGYAIMQAVMILTDGQMQIVTGTLYRSIKKLLDAGLIIETDERPDPALDDERRRYYRITELGERIATAEVKRLAHLVNAQPAKRLLGKV